MKCRGSCKHPLCARQQENQEQDKGGAASGGAVYDIKGQLSSVHSWLQARLITLHRHAHKRKCTHTVHIHSTHACTHVYTHGTHTYTAHAQMHTQYRYMDMVHMCAHVHVCAHVAHIYI